jgi:alcohol dehydrogenase (NADP+)
MLSAKSYAAYDAETPLKPYALSRREPGPTDVVIDIKYCGICHTDIHFTRNELGFSRYPMVPGHEIAGVVTSVGSQVSKFNPGDTVGVGCLVNSCRGCENCAEGLEQYCPKGVYTYGGDDVDGTITQGGYSTLVVVDQDFVLNIPKNLPLDSAAPLLCAGITTYSPLRTWNAGPGTRVAVVGLGGLGHMAVKLAAAMGCEVTVISTSDRKKNDALRMGATNFLISRDEASMAAAANSFDLILNTVSAASEVNRLISLLGRD